MGTTRQTRSRLSVCFVRWTVGRLISLKRSESRTNPARSRGTAALSMAVVLV